jgi:hypothetical protein
MYKRNHVLEIFLLVITDDSRLWPKHVVSVSGIGNIEVSK